MNTVFWSPKAEDTYLAILETTYYFSVSAALELDEKLEKLLDRLRKYKHSCPPAPSLPEAYLRYSTATTIGSDHPLFAAPLPKDFTCIHISAACGRPLTTNVRLLLYSPFFQEAP